MRPRYIAVEGPIGVGKTSLCRRLAESFDYEMLLEKSEENPFLDRFYRDPRQHALSTQLFFLLQRAQQIEEIRQEDIFKPVRVADFLIDKDRIFAQHTLEPDEFQLYESIYEHLTLQAPVPDLVIYLQAPTDILMHRIRIRGIASEQFIDRSYLDRLNESYMEFFHYYDATSLLIVNTAQIDLVGNDRDYEQLVDYILDLPSGINYFNPRPDLL